MTFVSLRAIKHFFLSIIVSISLTLGFGFMVHAQEVNSAPVESSELIEMFLGNEDAPVEVIEYASFTCPHCASFHASVFPELKKNYIDTGKVKFIFREVYFEKLGVWAGLLAHCGGAEKYFGIADILFQKQREWTAGETDADITRNLFNLGRAVGMNDAQMQSCMTDRDHAQKLVAAYQANAKRDGIVSTPSFVINGVTHRNQSYADLRDLIESALGN